MKRLISTVVFSVCAFSFLAFAQGSIDGKWAGEVAGGRGPQQVALTLKAEGGKLTGTVAGRGGETPIEDGTFANNAVKFKSKMMGRGGEVVLNWDGMLKGDELAMKRQAEGQAMAQEFTLKRQP